MGARRLWVLVKRLLRTKAAYAQADDWTWSLTHALMTGRTSPRADASPAPTPKPKHMSTADEVRRFLMGR